MGKIRGTPCMRSHNSAHHATTKYFSNSFVLKNNIEKEGLPGGGPAGLGAGGLRFKSGRPDQTFQILGRAIQASSPELPLLRAIPRTLLRPLLSLLTDFLLLQLRLS